MRLSRATTFKTASLARGWSISALFTALFVIAAMPAKANLIIDVVGTSGAGFTTWTFSTVAPGITEGDSSIRTNSGNIFLAGDTGQFPFGINTILDTTIQNTVFALTGNATVTVGGTTELITGIFLDDDGDSADDLGIRVANTLSYLQNDEATWTGSGTLAVDIDTFVLGTEIISDAGAQRMFLSELITVNFSNAPVPIPVTFALMLIGIAGLFGARTARKS